MRRCISEYEFKVDVTILTPYSIYNHCLGITVTNIFKDTTHLMFNVNIMASPTKAAHFSNRLQSPGQRKEREYFRYTTKFTHWPWPEQTVEETIELPMIWDVLMLVCCHCNRVDWNYFKTDSVAEHAAICVHQPIPLNTICSRWVIFDGRRAALNFFFNFMAIFCARYSTILCYRSFYRF